MTNPTTSSNQNSIISHDVPHDLQLSFSDPQPGWVWLVGMGPGHMGLLTLLAAHALRHADVIIHDHLMDEGFRRLGPQADWVLAGKRGGKASPGQSDVSALMIDAAKSGARVVRLKGGDPFVFGRGGEEVEDLVRANVPFHVVPGVTVGVAGLAAAGVPATHRVYNHSVTFVTAHGPEGGLSQQVNWRTMSELPALVVFMPLKQCQVLAETLVGFGKEAETPVWIVGRATLHDQWVVKMTLGEAAKGQHAPPNEGPALLAVGEFLNFGDQMQFLNPFLPPIHRSNSVSLNREGVA